MAPSRAKGTANPAPVASLSWEQVRRWRLRRHHLEERAPRAEMLRVVADLGGLHAQLISSAELTLWSRLDEIEPGAVARALWTERSLVKTWAMRGTLHLLPAAEYATWQAALGTYRHHLTPGWFRGFGITPEEMTAMLAAIDAALGEGALTREELVAEVVRRTGSTALGDKMRGSWGSLLKPAANQGRLCFAPSAGQLVRFTRPDRWLAAGSLQPVEAAAAMREVTRRFLAVSGPASRDDFGHWWGVATAPAGRALAALGEEIAPVEVEGMAAWMLAADLAEAAGAGPTRSVRLLPAFDQYVVAASRHTDRLLPGDLRDRVFRPQGWLSPVLLVDGRMDGVWRHKKKGSRLLVEIEPFVEPARWARAGAEAEAERLAGFLGGRLEVVWRSG